MFLPILILLMVLGGGLTILGFILERFVLYPKIFNKIGKKCYIAQSIKQRDRYIEFYRKICEKEGASLCYYNALINIEKYGKVLIKAVFLILFLQIGIIIIMGLSSDQLHFVK